MKRWASWYAAILLMVAAGCGDKDLRDRDIVCTAPTPEGYASDTISRSDWIGVLLEEPGREKDCAGRWVAPIPLPSRCPASPRPERAKPLGQQEEHAVVKPAKGNFVLAWTPVQEFDDGEAGGPVALVHTAKSRFSVVALGNLRLPKDRADLEVRTIGGEEVVFATGTRCPRGGGPAECETELRLLLLYQGDLIPLELRDPENRCVGATEIGVRRTRTVRLPNGWTRRFRFSTSYVIDGSELELLEQLIAHDLPPGGDESQERLFRRSEARRTLEFTGAYFIYDEASLWTSMQRTLGELN